MGDEDRHRRKSSTNLYRNMTVSKALAVLKISEREFRELSDLEFRTTFTRRNSISTGFPVLQDVSSASVGAHAGDKERKASSSSKPPGEKPKGLFIRVGKEAFRSK